MAQAKRGYPMSDNLAQPDLRPHSDGGAIGNPAPQREPTPEFLCEHQKREGYPCEICNPPSSVGYVQRVGVSSCIRCEFKTSAEMSFAEQDSAMMAHLAGKHPGWMTENLSLTSKSELESRPEVSVALSCGITMKQMDDFFGSLCAHGIGITLTPADAYIDEARKHGEQLAGAPANCACGGVNKHWSFHSPDHCYGSGGSEVRRGVGAPAGEPRDKSEGSAPDSFSPALPDPPELPVDEKFTFWRDEEGDYIVEAQRHRQHLAGHGTTPDDAIFRMRHILAMVPAPSPAKDEPRQITGYTRSSDEGGIAEEPVYASLSAQVEDQGGQDEHLAYLGLKAEVDALHEWLGPRTNYPGTSWGRTLVDEVKAKLAASVSPVEPSRHDFPEVQMQHLINAGVNGFAFELVSESLAGKTDIHTFHPLRFQFRGVRYTLEPAPLSSPKEGK